MTDRPVNRLTRALAWVAALLLLAERPAGADDRAAIEELRSRLETLEHKSASLEKQNQELMKLLGPSPPSRMDPPAGDGPGKEPGAGGGDGQPGKEGKAQKPPAEPKREAGDWFEIGKQLDLRARWYDGVWFLETADKAFRIHVGGRGQFDVVWLDADRNVEFGKGGVGPVFGGVNFRRARLDVDGTLYDTFDFYVQYDFLNTFNFEPAGGPDPATTANTPVPTDLWVTITHLPWIGNLRIGNQKPPISFEHMTSSRFLNFLERSLAFDAFIENQDNGFRPGIQAFNWVLDERASWAIGLFAPSRNIYGWNVGDGEWEVTGRLTGLPVYQNDGRCLVHLGLGASYVKPDDGIARQRARTLLRNGPAVLQPIVAEVRPFAESQQLLVPEFAVVWGPFTFVAEYYASWVQDTRDALRPGGRALNKGTTFYHGFYAEALCFLTGEYRTYNRRARDTRRIASFDRVFPNENFFFVKQEDGKLGLGRGAWQVGARYSYIDLQDKGIGIGIVHDVTLGLNWFWNPNSKLQFNYIVEHRDVASPNTADGLIHGFGTRLAWDF